MDHCFVKYKTRTFTQFVIKMVLQDFRRYGYPEEILDFDYEKDIDLCFNGSIFDIDRGLVLKLAEGKEVVRALRGF